MRFGSHARRGNYSMLFALTMIIVLGFGALSLDVGLMTMSRLQAQATADAASHAALVVYHENMNTSEGVAAAEWVRTHSSVGMGTPTMAGLPEFGIWGFADPTPAFATVGPGETPNAVRVTVERVDSNAVQTMLGGFLGVPSFEVRATSVAAQEMRSLMLVQDMSGSMMYESTPIIDSRTATLHFYQYLRDHPQPLDKLGLAMFASTGTTAYTSPPYFNLDRTVDPWLPLMLIEGNDTQFETAINGICNTLSSASCGSHSGVDDPHPSSTDIGECTNPAIGLQQAIDQLDDPSNNDHFKGILLFSDGVPTSTGSFFCGDSAGAAANANAAATEAWNKDINIWALLLHGSDFDTGFMQGIVRGVGFYQESSDSGDLDAMYQQVARSLPTTFVD